jgi:autotransporter-associated beta strand protein
VSSGGSGYIDTPVVTITNISASGSGATAVANVSGGAITSITVTSPGHDYGSGDTLGVAVVGGGGSGAVIGTPVLAANTGGGLTKQGIGTLTLSGANTYAGNTTVSAGTLEIVNPVLAAASTVSVASGAVLQLDFSVTNSVAGLVLNGVTQATGVYNSTTSPAYISGAGSLLVPSTIATNPTNITFSVSGSTLSLSWPMDHLGWILQSQTNNLGTGLGANWVDVPGSASVTSTNMPVIPANPTVFYRLRKP